MIGVKLGKTSHFIPILENNGNSVIIGDPLRGREELNLEEFHQRYAFTGFTLTASP